MGERELIERVIAALEQTGAPTTLSGLSAALSVSSPRISSALSHEIARNDDTRLYRVAQGVYGLKSYGRTEVPHKEIDTFAELEKIMTEIETPDALTLALVLEAVQGLHNVVEGMLDRYVELERKAAAYDRLRAAWMDPTE